MRYAVTGDHRSFYQKHQTIELEELLSNEQLQSLWSSIEMGLAQRLNLKYRNLVDQTPDKLFSAGRDLWRISEGVKKVVTQSSLANVVAEITGNRMMRLGYDQFFPTLQKTLDDSKNSYGTFLEGNYSLEQASCIQGVLCGLMICLKSHPEPLLENEPAPVVVSQLSNAEPYVQPAPISNINIFSRKAGNGVLFAPQTTIDWKKMAAHAEQRYLLIVYTQATSVYIYNSNDPQSNHLKSCGYTLGDKLVEKLNPTVHR